MPPASIPLQRLRRVQLELPLLVSYAIEESNSYLPVSIGLNLRVVVLEDHVSGQELGVRWPVKLSRD